MLSRVKLNNFYNYSMFSKLKQLILIKMSIVIQDPSIALQRQHIVIFKYFQ